MNYSIINVVEVLNKVFIEIINEILKCIISSFMNNQVCLFFVIFKP